MRSASSTLSSSSWKGSTSLEESSSSSWRRARRHPSAAGRCGSPRCAGRARHARARRTRAAAPARPRAPRASARVHHELHDARAVAQVDEDEAAVVAPAADPARERQLAARVLGARLAAQHVPIGAHCSAHAPLHVVHDIAERDLGLSVPDDATRAVAGAADRDDPRAQALGVPQLALEAAAGEVGLAGEAARARLLEQRVQLGRAAVVLAGDEPVDDGAAAALRRRRPRARARCARCRSRSPRPARDCRRSARPARRSARRRRCCRPASHRPG